MSKRIIHVADLVIYERFLSRKVAVKNICTKNMTIQWQDEFIIFIVACREVSTFGEAVLPERKSSILCSVVVPNELTLKVLEYTRNRATPMIIYREKSVENIGEGCVWEKQSKNVHVLILTNLINRLGESVIRSRGNRSDGQINSSCGWK